MEPLELLEEQIYHFNLGIVNQLLNSSNWARVHVVVRREIQEWANHPNKSKLQVQLLKDMDQLVKPEQFQYKGFDSLFCCLGSRQKNDQQMLVKIDKTYPLLAAYIALKNHIPHFLMVSSGKADENSWFLLFRIKSQVQRDLKLKKLPLLTILKPGLLQGRHDQRFHEKIGLFFPFEKIHVKDVGKILRKTAERDFQKAKKSEQWVQIYLNEHMHQILKQ